MMTLATSSEYAIGDQTDLQAFRRGEPSLLKQLDGIRKSLTDRIEDLAEEGVALSDRYQTERGQPHFVLYNGYLKEEGVEGVQVILRDDFSADAQIKAINEIADATFTAARVMKTELAKKRLVWRRKPTISRALCEDGLHLAISIRMAWD